MPRVFQCSIPGAMCDAGCGTTIVGALTAKGIQVDNININIPARSCTIVLPDSISLQDSEIEEILEEVGFPSFGTKSDIFKLFCRGLGGTFFGSVLLLLTAWGIAIPFIVALISIGASIYLGWEIYIQAWRTKIAIDILFALSTAIMLVVSIVGLALPFLGIHLLFDMVLLTFGFRFLGVALQKYIRNNQTGEQSLLDRIPPEHVVKVVKDETEIEVALKDLQPGDIISLSGGQYVPVDVKCLRECAVIDVMTDGQVANAKIFLAGAPLKQGMSIDLTLQIAQRFEVAATYQDSYCCKLYSFIKELQNQAQDPNFDKVIRYFVVAVVLIAIITGLLFYGWLCPWQLTLKAVICVLTSACSCTLGLNKGLSMRVVRSKMQNENIQCSNIKLLQKPLTDLVCDLNGTLTEAEPSEIIVVDLGKTKQDINQLIYRIEKDEVHPYARAICKKLTSQNPALISEFKNEHLPYLDRSNHSGITATIGDNKVRYRIGNENMMRGKLAEYKEIIHVREESQATPCQYIYIEEVEGESAQLVAYIKVGVKLRRDFGKTIKYFQDEKKMQVHILSGADEKTVRAYLTSAGIKNVIIRANCTALPQSESKNDKLTYIQQLQQQGKGVVGVGDAANDIPFLLQCDMGVAMQSPVADTMTQTVANFSIQSLADLQLKLPIAEAISRDGAQFKNYIDIISCVLNLLIMFVPMFFMGLLGFACPPCLGPLLMFVPLLGVCAHTGYIAMKKPSIVSKPSLSIPGTTASLLTPEGLGSPSPRPSREYVPAHDPKVEQGFVAPMIRLTPLPDHESGQTYSSCFK